MAVTFMTNDQWAQRKGFTQFLTDAGNGFVDKNDFPTALGLDGYRDDAYGDITDYIPGIPDTATYGKQLLKLEYNIVELTIDAEQGRETEDGRPIYIPREYLTPEQKERCSGYGSLFNRGTSN